MQLWPYPYNIGRKAYLGTNDSTRTERSELSEYNTDRGVAGVDFSFEVYGGTENTRQTVYYAFIAVSSNTDRWTITTNSSKATAATNQFFVPNTDPQQYALNRDISTTGTGRTILNRNGVGIHYDLARLQGVNGTELNITLRASSGTPTLYYAYFTGSRYFEYNAVTSIQENYLDPGLVIQRSLYGQVSKQRLPSARRKWQTNYQVFISPHTGISFETWFSFLQSRLQSDQFLFAEDFDRNPWRVYPAIITNREESIQILNGPKTVFSFPLQIEEI